MTKENKFQGKTQIELFAEALAAAGVTNVCVTNECSVSFQLNDYSMGAALDGDRIKIFDPFFLSLKTGSREDQYVDLALEKFYKTYDTDCVMKTWVREEGNTIYSIFCYAANTYPDYDPKKIKRMFASIAVFGEWILSHLKACIEHGGWPDE